MVSGRLALIATLLNAFRAFAFDPDALSPLDTWAGILSDRPESAALLDGIVKWLK